MDMFGRILMVEDDPQDVELTLTALGEYNLANEVVVTGDGKRPWTIFIAGETSGAYQRESRRPCCSISSCPRSMDWKCCSRSSGREAENDSRGGTDLFPRRKRHGGEL